MTSPAEMVETQLRARGIHDRRVLDAMLRIPREQFVPENLRGQAYEDSPLPIGFGQTITQPYMTALMVELLSAFAITISWTTIRGSAVGSAASAMDHRVWPGCTMILCIPW